MFQSQILSCPIVLPVPGSHATPAVRISTSPSGSRSAANAPRARVAPPVVQLWRFSSTMDPLLRLRIVSWAFDVPLSVDYMEAFIKS